MKEVVLSNSSSLPHIDPSKKRSSLLHEEKRIILPGVKKKHRRVTVGGDKGYDNDAFVRATRKNP